MVNMNFDILNSMQLMFRHFVDRSTLTVTIRVKIWLYLKMICIYNLDLRSSVNIAPL